MNDKISFLPPEDLQPHFIFSALSETIDWGLSTLGIPEAHKHTQGEGVIVAVLDTGAPDHLDINDNLLPALNCSGSGDASDCQGHGTHVAGIIAAIANGIGVLGIAPKAKILPIKVLDDYGQSGFQQIEDGIRAAIAAGVDIINMSLGSTCCPPESFHQAVKDAADRGIIIVAAAGNDSGQVNYPAAYPEIIAVSAIDRKGHIAPFSSHGPQVAFGAPGVNIYSTYLHNQYALLSGTSQASPMIAGVCGLILAWHRAQGLPPVDGLKDMLRCLDQLTDDAGRFPFSRDSEVGFGIPRFANVDWDAPIV